MTEPGGTTTVPWRGRRLVLAILAFSVILLVSLFALRACRETEPRPRISPWAIDITRARASAEC